MTLKSESPAPDSSILLDMATQVSEQPQPESKIKFVVFPAILEVNILIPDTQKSFGMYLISFPGFRHIIPPLPLPPLSKLQVSLAETPVPVPKLVSLLLLEDLYVPEDIKGQ